MIISEIEQLASAIKAIEKADILFCDTETTGLDPHSADLLLLQIRANDENYIFDFTRLDLEFVAERLRPIFLNDAVKVFHNAVFDFKMIRKHIGVDLNNVYCTMIADQMLNAGYKLRCSLQEVTARRLGVYMDKSVRDGFIGHDRSQPLGQSAFDYATKDVEVLEPIFHQQLREVDEQNLQRVLELERSLIPVTADMEYNGVYINKKRLEKARPAFQQLIENFYKAIQDEVIGSGSAEEIVFTRDGYYAIKPSSPQQMLACMNGMGIEVATTDSKELIAWDQRWALKHKKLVEDDHDEDDDMNIGYAHPFLKKRAIYIAAKKLLGTYIEGLLGAINPVTGKIHTSFNQYGAAATGRYSSSEPVNLQNIPQSDKFKRLGMAEHDIRSMFEAGDGNVFCIADLAAIELVILAAMSQDENLIYQIGHGDIHSFVASTLFGVDVNKSNKEIEPYKSFRNASKKTTYSIMYGTGGRNLYRSLSLQLSLVGYHMKPEDGDKWINLWKHQLFPKTGALLEQNSQHAITRFYTESVLGRRRRWSRDIMQAKKLIFAAMREGANQPIQASSADLLKMAMVDLYNRLDRAKAHIVMTVHDEIVVESKEEYVEEAAGLMKYCMENAGKVLFPNLPDGYIKTEPKISKVYDK